MVSLSTKMSAGRSDGAFEGGSDGVSTSIVIIDGMMESVVALTWGIMRKEICVLSMGGIGDLVNYMSCDVSRLSLARLKH